MTNDDYNMLMTNWASAIKLAFQPSIDLQSQISNMLVPVREAIILALEPLNDITLACHTLIESMVEPLRILSEGLNDSLSVPLQDLSAQLTEIFKSYNLESFGPFSEVASDEFINLSNEILDDFSSYDLPTEATDEVSKTLEISKAGVLTLDRMIAIIVLIVTIFSVIHDFLPDKSIQETNRKLQQLIEIQSHQIELLESLSESQDFPSK